MAYIYSYQLQSNRMTITRIEKWMEIRKWVWMKRALHIHFKHPIGRKWIANNPILDRIASDPFPCRGLAMSEEAREKCIRYSNIINTIVCLTVPCTICVCLFVYLCLSLFFCLNSLCVFLYFFRVFFRFIPGTVAHSHFIKHYHAFGMRHIMHTRTYIVVEFK